MRPGSRRATDMELPRDRGGSAIAPVGRGGAGACRDVAGSRRVPCRCGASCGRTIFVEPDPPHRRPQSRRPRVLVVGFLYLNQFRDGSDRGARAKPDDAGRDHRRRDRGFGDGGHRFDHHRSRTSCCNCRPAKASAPAPTSSTTSNSRSIPSASRRCCVGWSRRPAPAPASTTATAGFCSIRASLFARRRSCAPICRRCDEAGAGPASSGSGSSSASLLPRHDLPRLPGAAGRQRHGLSRRSTAR